MPEDFSRSRVATDLTLARLREVEGAKLYRGNAFRVVGLPTHADRGAVRQRQRQLMPAVEAGADVDLGHDLPVGLDDLRGAFDRLLNSPHARLVDEIFWLWGDVRDDCHCPWSVHHDHDEAVRAHSAALDLEAKGGDLSDAELDQAEQLWATVSRMWGRVLRQDACWQHLRARVVALDEKQIDESIVDALRQRVPLSLLRPLIDLAVASTDEQSWLADRARTWPAVPQRVIDDLLEEAAGDWYDAADKAINTAYEKIGLNQLEQGANLVYQNAMPQLRKLDTLVPRAKHRRTAKVYDDAAVVLSNCATRLVEKSTLAGERNARKWYGSARELATDPETVRTIDNNVAMLNRLAAARTVPGHTYRPPSRPASSGSAKGCFWALFWFLLAIGLLIWGHSGDPGGFFSMAANLDWRIR